MSVRNSWATPDEFTEGVLERFHIDKFDLDVCADEHNTKAKVYYDEKTDGLKQPWYLPERDITIVWCNPPYSNIMPWIEKAGEQLIQKVECIHLFMLLPNDCSTRWFKELMKVSKQAYLSEVYYLAPRIQFVSPPGVKASSNTMSSILWRVASRKRVRGGSLGNMFNAEYWRWKEEDGTD